MKIEGRVVRWWLCLLVVSSVLAPGVRAQGAAAPAGGGGTEIQVVASDRRGVVLEVHLADPLLSRQVMAGRPWDLLSLPGWGLTAEPGRPQLPVRRFLVGIPLDATVRLEVAEQEVHQAGPLDIPPAPQITFRLPPLDRPEGWPTPPEFEEEFAPAAEVYGADAFYPPAVADLVEVGFIRSQRVAAIALTPVQYNPVTRQARVHSHLTVRLAFAYPGGDLPPAPSSTQERESPAFERILQGQLLNYESARAWRGRPAPAPLSPDWPLPGAACKLYVAQDGLYRLTYDQLVAAGVPVDALDPRTFQLFTAGTEVAIRVIGEEDGQFDPTDLVLFYGQGIRHKYADRNVYWLTWGQTLGRRMPTRNGQPGGPLPQPTSFTAQARLEQDLIYYTHYPGDDWTDRWAWQFIIAPGNATATVDLTGLSTEPMTASLGVALLAYNADSGVNPDHHARFYVNDQYVGEHWWDGTDSVQWVTLTFPGSYLLNGSNALRVNLPGDTGAAVEYTLVDRYELSYGHTFQAEANRLSFTQEVTGAWEYRVAGFTAPDVEVYDISSPLTVSQIVNLAVEPVSTTYTVRFTDTVAGSTSYLALTPDRRLTPPQIVADSPSNLHDPANGADLLILSPADFITAANTLADYRAGQGLRSRVVLLQDVYDEFGYGLPTPEAIRDFLRYTLEQWTPPAPTYVLLLGDGTYDPKNHVNQGVINYLSPYLAFVDPWMGETAADNRYVCLSGSDTWPDMLLGRLPANSLAQAAGMVDKVIAYEGGMHGAPWNSHLLFYTDNPDEAGDFYALSDDVADHYVPPPYTVTKLYLGQHCFSGNDCRQQLVNTLNQTGALLVNYIGHGSIVQWAAENLFHVSTVEQLTNADRLPVMLPMTCLEGFFISPYPSAPCIGESLVRATDKGAVASWSPSGLGVVSGHDYLNKGFFDALFFEGVRDLGSATLMGKLWLYNAGHSLDLIDTYLLFGDPALRVNALDADLQVQKRVEPAGQVEPGDLLTYTLTFTNAGPATTYGVLLTDLIPVQLLSPTVVYASPTVIAPRPGITFAWTIANLLAGEGGQVQVQATVGPLTQSQTVVNQVEIAGRTPDPNLANNSDGVSTPVYVPLADLQIGKAVEPPGQVGPGDLLTYTLAFTNAGPDVAYQVLLTDLVPAELVSPTLLDSSPPGLVPRPGITFAWTISDLPPGGGGQIRFQAVVSPTAAPGFVVVNGAEIGSSTMDPDLLNNHVSVTTGVQVPDLFVRKLGPDAVAFSQTITYTVTWGNNGLAVAPGARLSDTLPSWVSYVADNSGLPLAQPSPGILVWTVPATVPTGTAESFVLTGQVAMDPHMFGPLVNRLRIKAEAPDGNPSDNLAVWSTDLLLPDPGLAVAGPAEATALSEIEYTLTFSNAGQATAQGVVITDRLPAGVSYRTDDSGLPHSEPLPGTIVWQVGRLPPGESRSFTIGAAVGDYAQVGDELHTLVTLGAASPDRDPANNQGEWTTALLLPDLAIGLDGPTGAVEGSLLTYTLACSNAGGGPAVGVVITGLLPVGAGYVADDSGLPRTRLSPRLYVWQVDQLSGGAGLTFHLVVQLGSLDQTGPLAVNEVRIGALSPDPLPANNESRWSTAVLAGPLSTYLPLVWKAGP